MIQALAPTLRRRCSWVWVTLVVAGVTVSPALLRAQPPQSKGAGPGATKAAPKEAPAPKDATTKEAQPPAEEPPPAVNLGGTVESFKDPRAEKALGVFKAVPGLRDCRPSDITQVKAAASTSGPVDTALVQRFVDGMAYRLIDKANLNGLIAPPPGTNLNSSVLRGVKDASANLLDVLFTARTAKNAGFLQAYNRALQATLPKLLDNNLVSRIEAMIVLGQAADPGALPIYMAQLKDANQTVWVKLWAARGISNLVDGGARVDQVLSVQQASAAGKALVDFLEAEKDAPWPAQMRALEAIGAMRQASQPTSLNKAEMAAVAMQFLADGEATPEVRSAAAWALGMMRVNPAVSGYNFQLVAYHIGLFAADLASDAAASYPAPKAAPRPAAKDASKTAKADAKKKDQAAEEAPAEVSASNPTLSEYLAGLLVAPVFQAFNGIEGVRESGLAKQTNLGQAAAYVKQIADLQSAAARASVELVRGTPGQYEGHIKNLHDRIAALKAALDKAPPKDFHLVPGTGPEYRPAAGEEKAADAAPAKDAGAKGGR